MNLKFILLSLLLVISSFGHVASTNKGCEQFKSGKYLFKLDSPGRYISFLIDRNDSIQTETEKSTGKYTKLSIKWVEPCTYEVKMLETTFDFPDSVQQIRKSTPTRTQIISWTNDYYIFKISRADYIMTDTMWIVH